MQILLLEVLTEVEDQGIVPDGYGLTEDETEEYSSIVEITVGAVKHVGIELSELVWKPRAVRWVQALETFNSVLLEYTA